MHMLQRHESNAIAWNIEHGTEAGYGANSISTRCPGVPVGVDVHAWQEKHR